MWFLIPLFAIVATFSIPIVAILMAHQRRMAEIIHQQHAQAYQQSPEILALRQEVHELRQLIHEQTIAMDDIRTQTRALANSQRPNALMP
jgi:uncharacterized membrane protein (DUF106 family)